MTERPRRQLLAFRRYEVGQRIDKNITMNRFGHVGRTARLYGVLPLLCESMRREGNDGLRIALLPQVSRCGQPIAR